MSKDKPECFVMMPVSDVDGYPAGHFGEVYRELIKPACEQAGFKPNLVSENKRSGLIHIEILQGVISAPIAICDVTGRNPNVLYELGLRQAFNKKTVIIKDNNPKDQFIFDISGIRHTRYQQELRAATVREDIPLIVEAIKETHAMSDEEALTFLKLLSLSPANVSSVDQGDILQAVLNKVTSIENEMFSRTISTLDAGTSNESWPDAANSQFNDSIASQYFHVAHKLGQRLSYYNDMNNYTKTSSDDRRFQIGFVDRHASMLDSLRILLVEYGGFSKKMQRIWDEIQDQVHLFHNSSK